MFDVAAPVVRAPRVRRHAGRQHHRHRRQDPRQGRRARPTVVGASPTPTSGRCTRPTTILGCLPPTYEPRATGHIPEMLEMIAPADRPRATPTSPPDGSGDVYFDVRSWPSYGELSNQRIDDMEPAEDADPRGKRDPRDFALWKGLQEGRGAGDRRVAGALGAGPAGLAPRVLGDGGQVPRRRVRHPRRRARPALPAPRERARPVDARPGGRSPRLWMHNAMVNLRRREDEQVASATRCSSARSSSGCGRSSCATTWSRRTTGRSSSSRFESLDEAGDGVPADRGLRRAGDRGRRAGYESAPRASAPRSPRRWTTTCRCRRRWRPSRGVIRRGQQAARRGGDSATRLLAATSPRCARMLDILGLDPLAEPWHVDVGGSDAAVARGARRAGRGAARAAAAGARPQGLRRRRRRSVTSCATRASRSRTRRRAHAGRSPAMTRRLTMAGNSKRQGAVRKRAGGNPTAGSGGRRRKRARGQGPDAEGGRPPGTQGASQAAKSADKRRFDGRLARGRRRRSVAGRGHAEWVAGRNSVVEALQAKIPVTTLYVAEHTERDDRVREAFKLAAERGLSDARGLPARARQDDRRRRPPGARAEGAAVRVCRRRTTS